MGLGSILPDNSSQRPKTSYIQSRKRRCFVVKYELVKTKPMDREIRRLMLEHDIDEDTAEKAQELIDEGLDEDEAVELADEI